MKTSRANAGLFSYGGDLRLLGFAVRTENLLDLVDVELLHVVAGGTQVLAGVELGGFGGEDLADGGGSWPDASRSRC